jgi:uncharacterized membrane protein
MARPTLPELEYRLKILEDEMVTINKVVISGNGTPSIVEEVHKAVQFIEEQKENQRYYSRLIVGGVIANILGYLLAAGIWFVRILPVLDQISKMGMRP